MQQSPMDRYRLEPVYAVVCEKLTEILAEPAAGACVLFTLGGVLEDISSFS